MSNEEYISKEEIVSNDEIISQGGDDMLERLWLNNKGIIHLAAKNWSNSGPAADWPKDERKILYQDLMQCGFLALVDAYEHYNPEKGGFTTLLPFYLRKHFRNWCASLSGWTRHQYNEATKNNIRVESLNRIVYSDDAGSDGIELGDLIPDPDDYFAELVDRLYIESLHGKLDKLLNRIKPQEKEAIRLRYYKEKSVEQIAEIMGLTDSRIGQILASGMRNLRQEAVKSDLAEYVDRNTDYYARVSVDTFQSTGSTSAVELIVMRRENMLNEMMNKTRAKAKGGKQ